MNGKRIWLTGATSGIGLALAEQLAAQGATLVLSARREPELRALAERLPGEHLVVPLDLNDTLHLGALVAPVLNKLGGLDILINNAGVSQRSLAQDTDMAVYRQVMEVNYFAVVALTKAVLPAMLAQGAGTIVAVSSVAGKVGSKLRSGYSGAKFAVLGFMDCLRAEVSGQGIQVLSICPGFVATDIARNALTGDGRRQGRSDEVIDRGINPHDCAARIIGAIEAGEDEVVIARGLPRLAVTLKAWLPSLVRRLAARQSLPQRAD
ncbi:SDR family oxidoreductase [Gallaecimonas sp. GXIMD4217]|uniref:SDR family oxidoreductase n=1 Tax=Gallaecimonas sp. GXIMD4217 TaxID=3131927 RepID=UPI00311AE6AD